MNTQPKDQQVLSALRQVYSQYGYQPYKMSKFEEYDLYVQNKDFLISDSVITFTDTNGKLMALKPDVTLSIIKNSKEQPGCVQKVYYTENVYRVSAAAHQYKEILQAGLECMGDIDEVQLHEVLVLAAASLDSIHSDWVLDVSHLGVPEALLAGLSPAVSADLLACLGEKNPHELRRRCEAAGVATETADKLCLLISTYGHPDKVLPLLKEALADTAAVEAIRQLETLLTPFAGTAVADRLRVDFSVVSDSRYYNGLVFKGFVNGVPDSVLSGGQYDKLMRRMGRSRGAVGFAVYLDELERLEQADPGYDVDTLLLYQPGCDLAGLKKAADALRQEGTVSVQQQVPAELRCRRMLRYINGEVTPCE
ncbi:MAG: ATP phosphoribosyltransferase regulatory subunit [Clostridia bacterium]|nr:ATP phosphoribosyltransferase regulatory subunit [Clostridia bacterium]